MLQQKCGCSGYLSRSETRQFKRQRSQRKSHRKVNKVDVYNKAKFEVAIYFDCGRETIKIDDVSRKHQINEKEVLKAFMRLEREGVLSRQILKIKEGPNVWVVDRYKIVKRPRFDLSEIEDFAQIL